MAEKFVTLSTKSTLINSEYFVKVSCIIPGNPSPQLIMPIQIGIEPEYDRQEDMNASAPNFTDPTVMPNVNLAVPHDSYNQYQYGNAGGQSQMMGGMMQPERMGRGTDSYNQFVQDKKFQ